MSGVSSSLESGSAGGSNARPEPPGSATGRVAAEIDGINIIVSKYFPVYDIRVGHNALVFRCKISEKDFDDKFISLKNELFSKGYIPLLTKDNGEHVLLVTRKPPARYRSVAINVVLLALTILTTILAGAWAYAMFDGKITIRPEDLGKTLGYFVNPHYLLLGAVFFALPLMLILGVHELGHYFMARRHGVAASLPFFMPIPPYPVSPLGTLGAFISVREPIPNKKALLDIGIAGPICGFIVALPITLAGLYLTAASAHPAPLDVTKYFIPGDSLLYYMMSSVFPGSGGYMLHPMAFAGWVGLLVTAINLLPAGQLDGGHIAHALFGSSSKYFSYGAVAVMLLLGLYSPSWFLFAFLIILLGLRHPPPLNDLSRLDVKRKVLGVFAILLLVVCFVPSPLTVQAEKYNVQLDKMAGEGYNRTVFINSTAELNFTVTNTGNTLENITITGKPPQGVFPPWGHAFRFYLDSRNSTELGFDVDVAEKKSVTMVVSIPNNSTIMNKTYDITVEARVTGTNVLKRLVFRAHVSNVSHLPVCAEMPGERAVDPHQIYFFERETVSCQPRHVVRWQDD